MSDRFAVAAALREIGGLVALEDRAPFRRRAYERAAHAIESLPGNLDDVVAGGRLTSVPGIGPKAARVVEQLVTTGRASLLDRLRAQFPPGVLELQEVVSLPRIRVLHEALGIVDLAGLRAACEAGRVRGVRGFGARTEARLLERIQALAERPAHLLLHQALPEGEALRGYLHAHPAVERAELGGDLRRRVESIGRLDVVVATADVPAVLAHAAAHPATTSVLERAPDRVHARLAGGLTADVRVVPQREFATAWLDATGSPAHLAKLVARAASLDGTLDARGLRLGRRRVPTREEADVYTGLGLAWVPPELREDTGEVEAAATGTLPDDLVDAGDIRGAVHCHTVASDGKHTIEQMARAADALGLTYLTITDHSRTAAYAGGLTIDRLRRQSDEIDRVQARMRVRLLRGTESDILKDGALDFPDAVLAELDVVIASIHERHRLDRRAMTRRLVRALRHPLFKIWGHALGRYVLSRPPIECDMDEVLDAAATSRTAIEVNGDPHRLDLAPRWIREARRRAVRFVISSDAHSTNAIANFRWGVDMARRGGVRRGEVLNVLDAETFQAAVRPAG